MNILCVSDIPDSLVYSLNAKERFKDIDMVLGAGDLSVEYLEYIASTLNKPVYFVYGNHNLNEFEYFLNLDKKAFHIRQFDVKRELLTGFASVCVENKSQKTKAGIIMGIGGCPVYSFSQHQYTEFQMNLRLLKMLPRLFLNKIFYGRYLDIFLTHAPPKGINDASDLPHRGFSCFLWFIKFFKPKYMLHGHVHLWDLNESRKNMLYETEVINVYSRYILNCPD